MSNIINYQDRLIGQCFINLKPHVACRSAEQLEAATRAAPNLWLTSMISSYKEMASQKPEEIHLKTVSSKILEVRFFFPSGLCSSAVIWETSSIQLDILIFQHATHLSVQTKTVFYFMPVILCSYSGFEAKREIIIKQFQDWDIEIVTARIYANHYSLLINTFLLVFLLSTSQRLHKIWLFCCCLGKAMLANYSINMQCS